MNCPDCGAENAPEAIFCSACGNALQPPAAEPSDATPVVPPPQQQYPAQQQPYVMAGPAVFQGPRADGFCVAGMVLGIIALVFCWIPIFAIVMGVLAIIFGGIGVGNVNKNPGMKTGSGMGVAGLITGIIALIVAVVIWIVVAAIIW